MLICLILAVLFPEFMRGIVVVGFVLCFIIGLIGVMLAILG